MRDAVVADDGGGGERADAAAGTAKPKSTTVTESGLAKTWNHTSGCGWNRRKQERQAEAKVCFKIF